MTSINDKSELNKESSIINLAEERNPSSQNFSQYMENTLNNPIQVPSNPKPVSTPNILLKNRRKRNSKSVTSNKDLQNVLN